MKKYQTTFMAILVMALIVPAVALMETPKAEAACSYQGYLSSGGKCSKSFKNFDRSSRDWGNEENDRYYRFNNNFQYSNNFGDFFGNRSGNDFRNDQIARLLELIALLQELLDRQSSFPGYNGNSLIDITTVSATNIEEDEARLRGEVDFNSSDEATVWFEYGTNPNRLTSKTDETKLDDSDDEDFSEVIDDLRDDTRYYFRAVGEDEDGDVDRGIRLSFITDDDDSSDNHPDAITEGADDIDDDSVELNGSVDMNDFDDGRVFFIYGEDESLVEDVEDDYDTYAEIDEEGDDLQKVSIKTGVDNDREYYLEIEGLDDDTDYYYSICVEYEDEDNDDVLVCGSVEDFTTDDSNSGSNEPDDSTDDADDVTRTTARLNGTVDMNDFNNGIVFFVYGTNEDKVEDVEDDYDTYSEVDEDGDELQKVLVDSDFDNEDSFSKVVTGLEPDTEYYASTCVQYEDDDDDDQLICASVESFETDS